MDDLRTSIEYEEDRKAHRDFRRARMGAVVRRLWGKLSSDLQTSERIGCFDHYRAKVGELCCSVTRRMIVETEFINGSVGRCTAFDSMYAPLCSCTSEKWISVAKALRAGTFLPPVKLYKIRDDHFVYDGNHRVSVARSRGVPAVEAIVKELFFDSEK